MLNYILPKKGASEAAIYLLILSAQFAFTYVPRHLTAIGWSAGGIGALLAANALARSIAMPLWAQYADSVTAHGRVARLLLVAGWFPIALFLVGGIKGEDLAFLALIGISITAGSALPLVDTHVLRERGREDFGRLRAWGSVGFGGGALAFSFAGNWQTHEQLAGYSPLVFGVLLFLAGVSSFGLTIRQRARVETLRWKNVLPATLALPIFIWLVHWISQAPYNIFLVHLAEESGLSAWVPGAAVAAGVVVEIAVLRLAGRHVERFDSPKLFIGCLFVTAFRWAAMAYCTDPLVFVGLQVLHGMTFGVFFLLMMRVLDEHVEAESRGAAQAILYVVVFGIGSAIGQWGSGLVLELYESAAALFLGAAGIEIALIIPALIWMKASQRN